MDRAVVETTGRRHMLNLEGSRQPYCRKAYPIMLTGPCLVQTPVGTDEAAAVDGVPVRPKPKTRRAVTNRSDAVSNAITRMAEARCSHPAPRRDRILL